METTEKTKKKHVDDVLKQNVMENVKAFNNYHQKNIYDPRILDTEDGDKTLWCSESVELALKGLKGGYKLKETPFLKQVKGAMLRKPHLPFKYTDDELEALSVIYDDKEFFCENFGKLKDGNRGWQHISLRDYQKKLLKKYSLEKWNIVMFPRQSGKTTTTVLDIVYYALTNIDKDIVVIAQSEKVIREILSKIRECFQGLPFFLQPGFISFNKNGFALDNGCRLVIGIASESVVQGYALDYLFIDEFAYIKPKMVKSFWNNIYPTLVNNPDSKCTLASTPNGRNLFWELWVGAELKTNRFIQSRIYWYEVPGRDEKFKLDTIANIGIEGWEMGFECSFDTQLKSIFRFQTQKLLRDNQLSHSNLWSVDNHYLGKLYNIEFISQNVVKYDLKNDWFIIGNDLAEGLGQDSTAFKIRKIDWCKTTKKLIYTTIGVLRDNEISIEDWAEKSMDILKHFDRSKTKVVVENNNYGGEYFAQIKSLMLTNKKYATFDKSIFAKFMRNSKKDFEFGIRWDAGNKKTAVKSFSSLVENKIFIETHNRSIEEYLNFGKDSNGSYKAQYGHDDLVMSDVGPAHFIKSNSILAVEFLKRAEDELRFLCNDVSIEKQIIEAEKKSKIENVYTYNGFTMRNHEEEYNKRNGKTTMLLPIC